LIVIANTSGQVAGTGTRTKGINMQLATYTVKNILAIIATARTKVTATISSKL